MTVNGLDAHGGMVSVTVYCDDQSGDRNGHCGSRTIEIFRRPQDEPGEWVGWNATEHRPGEYDPDRYRLRCSFCGLDAVASADTMKQDLFPAFEALVASDLPWRVPLRMIVKVLSS
jgi:hypothetical protein